MDICVRLGPQVTLGRESTVANGPYEVCPSTVLLGIEVRDLFDGGAVNPNRPSPRDVGIPCADEVDIRFENSGDGLAGAGVELAGGCNVSVAAALLADRVDAAAGDDPVSARVAVRQPVVCFFPHAVGGDIVRGFRNKEAWHVVILTTCHARLR